ncbi:hypothetical protein Tco_1003315 [Tanacetum coccineum]|uniref:Uncharacterized protein n=1 Tax=Tanacetum coccineum TaxID=301880 RepID=A0ABQ5FB21_9ASTR
MKKYEDYCSDNQYAVSIKEDTAYLSLHFTKDYEGNKIQYTVSRKDQYAIFKPYGNKISWKISNVNSTCLGLRKKYRLNLKNDMPPRDKKHFKTLSLDGSRSPDFDLFSNQDEYLEEEVAEIMAETMEQYMSKTQADYGSGVARPKIEDKDKF